MRVFVFWLMLCGTALGQATRPATEPALVGVRPEYLKALQIELEQLRAEVAKLRKELQQFHATAAPDEAIQNAIKAGRLAVGMSLEQADMAMKNSNSGEYVQHRLKRESDGRQLYEFKFADQVIGRQRIIGHIQWAWFENGRIVEWSKD